MSWFIDLNDCCGCSACAQICPKGCIQMLPDREGFLSPAIKTINCINCRKCETVCPVIKAKSNQHALPMKTFIGRVKDNDVLLKCSSGGIFLSLATIIIRNHGVVFGVKFDKEWNTKVDFTEHLDGLNDFIGSKYVASMVGDAFQRAKSFLVEGRQVLFSGTPCQISGLNLYLGKSYDNLITVDIMCHGVPSPLIWQRYLNEVSRDLDIKNVSFRSKSFGWNRYGLKIETNCSTIEEPNDLNPYMQGFINGLFNRKSCSNCPSRNFSSGSDIMLGDFWELESKFPEMFDNKGMSTALVMTPKGLNLFQSLKETCYIQEISFNDIDSSGHHYTLLNSIPIHPNRESFFREVLKKKNSGHIQELILSSIPPKKNSLLKRIRNKIIKGLSKCGKITR